MKRLYFLGDSRKRLRECNKSIRQDIGFQLDKTQRGEQPDDCKPNAIYVLHLFQKKTQTTAQLDIDIAKKRFSELMRYMK